MGYKRLRCMNKSDILYIYMILFFNDILFKVSLFIYNIIISKNIST